MNCCRDGHEHGKNENHNHDVTSYDSNANGPNWIQVGAVLLIIVLVAGFALTFLK